MDDYHCNENTNLHKLHFVYKKQLDNKKTIDKVGVWTSVNIVTFSFYCNVTPPYFQFAYLTTN